MNFKIGKTTICLSQGDITEIESDAIVNAANSRLMGGGGVDGAIHRKGGPKILEECKKIRERDWPNGLPTGRAVITTGGNLKVRHVIHTVGPIWQDGTHREEELLTSSYKNSLKLAKEKGLKSIAFPSISTGAYGYPIEKASRVAIKAIREFLEKDNFLDKVIIILFTSSDFEIYQKVMKEGFNIE